MRNKVTILFLALCCVAALACEHGDTVKVWVNANGWRQVEVDRCIAPIISALNSNGIPTYTSCCGHGAGTNGFIRLKDRILIVTPQTNVAGASALYRKDWEPMARRNQRITSMTKGK